MNAERLHAIVIVLNHEMEERAITQNMEQMVSALESVVNEPDPSYQQTLAASIKDMYTAVTDTPSDKFSPAWRQILSEMGGDEIFGNNLKKKVETVFATNQITPAVALKELQGILQRLQEFKAALEQAASALRVLNIGDEKLQPGDCEIGVLIPRSAISNDLLKFAAELKELGFILNTFSEVATGKQVELQIRTISSSDLLVYLQAVAPYAACVAVAIERVVNSYKQILEIRKLRQELRNQGVPDESTTGIENHANQIMEDGIRKASADIIKDFYTQEDIGRQNELTTAVKISLNKIANRIDQGFNLEVRVEPITEENQPANNGELQKAIATIQSAVPNMQFLRIAGKPILKLPESKEKPKKKD